MRINFYKYQGTGNDFVIIDNRNNCFDKNNLDLIQKLCNRKFGIGADGLILIENIVGYDFNMIYYNADGTQSFCGNGSRCAVAFAKKLGIITSEVLFLSNDGEHQAKIDINDEVSLKMHDVLEIEKGENYYFINTGSPHYITEVNQLNDFDVFKEGKKIRNNERFKAKGTNVNFVKYKTDSIDIRTYERGVENETLSCGTGVSATALSWADKFGVKNGLIQINTKGGELKVRFNRDENGFNGIWLIGPATFVFKGEIEIRN